MRKAFNLAIGPLVYVAQTLSAAANNRYVQFAAAVFIVHLAYTTNADEFDENLAMLRVRLGNYISLCKQMLIDKSKCHPLLEQYSNQIISAIRGINAKDTSKEESVVSAMLEKLHSKIPPHLMPLIQEILQKTAKQAAPLFFQDNLISAVNSVISVTCKFYTNAKQVLEAGNLLDTCNAMPVVPPETEELFFRRS